MRREPKRILLVRLSSVGDIVLATPVARTLRSLFPAAHLTWLVDRGFADLIRESPLLNAVICFDSEGTHAGPMGLLRLARQIGPVDFLVDLQHKVRTVGLTKLIQPAERRVMVKRRGTDLVRALIGHERVLRGPHQIARYIEVLGEPTQSVPEPELSLDIDHLREARSRFAVFGGRPVIGLVIGTRHATKAWPLASAVELAARCVRTGLGVALLGGPEEAALLAPLRRDLPVGSVLNLVEGRLSELAARLACCDAVVSPDSGPAHMAAALGVPTITLFGPTAPERWAPIGRAVEVVRLDLPCSPCSNHGGSTCPLGTFACMRGIEPRVVFKHLLVLLDRMKGSPGQVRHACEGFVPNA